MKRFADAHIHAQTVNDDAAIKNMLDTISCMGVTDAILLSVSDFDITQNLCMLYSKMNYKKINLRVFGAVDSLEKYITGVPYEKQAEELLDMGCDGIKMLDMKPNRRKLLKKGINDTSYDRMFDMLEERQVPVLIHAADPETFWDENPDDPHAFERGWYYGDGTFPSKQQIYNEVFEMLDKHKNLSVTFAHFFFLSNFIDEAKRVMEKYPNVKFDITPGWEMFVGFSKKIDEWHDFFEQYSDRILFGTDSCLSWKDPKTYAIKVNELVCTAISHDKSEFVMPYFNSSIIKGLDLSEDTIEKIKYKNFAAFVGEDTKPVNTDKFYAAAEEMLKNIKNDASMANSAEWLKNVLKNK